MIGSIWWMLEKKSFSFSSFTFFSRINLGVWWYENMTQNHHFKRSTISERPGLTTVKYSIYQQLNYTENQVYFRDIMISIVDRVRVKFICSDSFPLECLFCERNEKNLPPSRPIRSHLNRNVTFMLPSKICWIAL